MNRQLRGNLPPNEKANGKNRFLSLLLLFMAFISVQVYARTSKFPVQLSRKLTNFRLSGLTLL